MNESGHTPVLLNEVLHGLDVRSDGIYVDGTYGRGGHSAAILSRLGEHGRLLVFDRDPRAVADAQRRFGKDARVSIVHASFDTLAHEVRQRGQLGKVSGVLLDLGVSSPQLEDGNRGFGFQYDGPLDMRFDPGTGTSAADWLNNAPAEDIEHVLRHFGEERFARRIARAIVAARAVSPLLRTAQLRELVAAAVPSRERRKDPATRSFLAIRLYVNRELESLQAALPAAVSVLRPGGRLVVISFHSLEDRIVKRFMRDQARGAAVPRELPVATAPHPVLRLVSRPLRPSEQERAINPRSRSAVLRVSEKVAA